MTHKNRDTSRILFNFRAGNHRLSVERMRYLGLPRHTRLCKHIPCRKHNIPGDENHIFSCPKNRISLLHLWDVLSTHPKVDSNSQNEIKLLKLAATDTYKWDGAWIRRWEMSLDLGIRLSMMLAINTVIKLLRAHWSPFKYHYCT